MRPNLPKKRRLRSIVLKDSLEERAPVGRFAPSSAPGAGTAAVATAVKSSDGKALVLGVICEAEEVVFASETIFDPNGPDDGVG